VLKRHRSTARIAPLHSPHPSSFTAPNVVRPASRLRRSSIVFALGIAIAAVLQSSEARAQRAQQKAVQRVADSTFNTRFSAFVDEAS
jgi:hypothetical protein